MKKRSWGKHLFLAGSIMVVALACQKKPDANASPQTEQSDPASDPASDSDSDASVDSEEDEACSAAESSSAAEDQSSAAQAETNAEPAAPLAGIEPATPEANIAAPSEEKVRSVESATEAKAAVPMAEEPRLEAVNAVSDFASDSSQD